MKNKNAILLVSVLALGLLMSGIYVRFLKSNNYTSKNKVPISNETNSIEPKNESSSDLTSWQEEWIDYKSQSGLSLRYPKLVAGKGCNSKSESFFVPTKVFEDTNDHAIYIAPEYYYDEDETGACKKYIASLDSLQKETANTYKPFLGWNITVSNVDKDNINALIKNIYGSGCKMESEKSWIKDGVNEIMFNSYKDAKGNPTSLDQTVCPINSSYKILYSEKQKLAVSIILGQECTFWGDSSSKCLDEQLVNSFELK